jgi:hypothetical protein
MADRSDPILRCLDMMTADLLEPVHAWLLQSRESVGSRAEFIRNVVRRIRLGEVAHRLEISDWQAGALPNLLLDDLTPVADPAVRHPTRRLLREIAALDDSRHQGAKASPERRDLLGVAHAVRVIVRPGELVDDLSGSVAVVTGRVNEALDSAIPRMGRAPGLVALFHEAGHRFRVDNPWYDEQAEDCYLRALTEARDPVKVAFHSIQKNIALHQGGVSRALSGLGFNGPSS